MPGTAISIRATASASSSVSASGVSLIRDIIRTLLDAVCALPCEVFMSSVHLSGYHMVSAAG